MTNTAATVRLDQATLDASDRPAMQAVEDVVALDAWAQAKINAGLAAAEAGDFASEQEVARVRAKFA